MYSLSLVQTYIFAISYVVFSSILQGGLQLHPNQFTSPMYQEMQNYTDAFSTKA